MYKRKPRNAQELYNEAPKKLTDPGWPKSQVLPHGGARGGGPRAPYRATTAPKEHEKTQDLKNVQTNLTKKESV